VAHRALGCTRGVPTNTLAGMRVKVYAIVEHGTYKRIYKFELASWLTYLWRWGRRVWFMVIVNPRDWGLTCTTCGCDQRGILCRSCVGKTCRGGCQGKGFTVVELMARRQRRTQLSQGMYQRVLADQTKVMTPPPLAQKPSWWATVKDVWAIIVGQDQVDEAMRQAWAGDRAKVEHTRSALPLLAKQPIKAEEFNV
jgi:hypothetical protein